MFEILSVPYDKWSGHRSVPGNFNTSKRRGIVCHHPYPHAVTAGAGLAVEIRELRTIDSFHRSKWAGIGYHFIIAESGRIFIGRGIDRTGAHSPGNNSSTYGIAYLIDGLRSRPSSAAMEATDHLISYLIRQDRLISGYSVKMHSEEQQTTCPGPVAEKFLEFYDWPHLAIKTPVVSDRRLLQQGMRGEDVRQLQRALNMLTRHQTGYYGPITERAVRGFQSTAGLLVDGVAGENTFKALYGD